MSRYSAGKLASGAGTTVFPSGSLYAATGSSFKMRECGISNTTATAAAFCLKTLSTRGTFGAGPTAFAQDDNAPATACTTADTHSAGTPISADAGYRAQLGAAVGSAFVWTFGDVGLRVAKGSANGIGIACENGTSQVIQWYFVWDE